MKKIKSFLKSIFNLYPKWLCKKEFINQSYKRYNERPVEYSFVFNFLKEKYPKTIIDIGTGITALPHLMRNCGFLVTAIDNVKDYWSLGMFNRHYYIIDDDITNTKIENKFDLVTCISVLEHISDFNNAVKNMCSLLKPNGYLILTFPYNEKKYIPNVYKLSGSSYGQDVSFITQSFSRENIDYWLENINIKIITQEYWEFWTGEFWTVGEQIIPPKKVGRNENHQLTCLLIKLLN